MNELKHIRFDSSQYPFRAYDNYTFTTSDLEQKDTITIADRTQIFRKDYPGVWTPGKCADGELKTFDECMPTWESGTCKNKDGNIIARGGSTPYAEQRAKSFCNQSRHTWITGRCQQDLETNARACWVTETDCERETHTWTPASCSTRICTQNLNAYLETHGIPLTAPMVLGDHKRIVNRTHGPPLTVPTTADVMKTNANRVANG